MIRRRPPQFFTPRGILVIALAILLAGCVGGYLVANIVGFIP